MRRLILLALLPLIACGTPRERCVASVTRDFRVLDQLIATSKGNLQRGYANESRGYYTTEYRVCGYVQGRYGPRAVWCDVDVWNNRTVQVAINLDDEAATLKTMEVKRHQLAKQAQPAIAQCEVLHPE